MRQHDERAQAAATGDRVRAGDRRTGPRDGHALLALQRSAGNRAVAGAVSVQRADLLDLPDDVLRIIAEQTARGAGGARDVGAFGRASRRTYRAVGVRGAAASVYPVPDTPGVAPARAHPSVGQLRHEKIMGLLRQRVPEFERLIGTAAGRPAATLMRWEQAARQLSMIVALRLRAALTPDERAEVDGFRTRVNQVLGKLSALVTLAQINPPSTWKRRAFGGQDTDSDPDDPDGRKRARPGKR